MTCEKFITELFCRIDDRQLLATRWRWVQLFLARPSLLGVVTRMVWNCVIRCDMTVTAINSESRGCRIIAGLPVSNGVSSWVINDLPPLDCPACHDLLPNQH